ncbi:nucleotidyltransferase domain-containing protein [Desulfofundulus thermobenzoicus]|uniref:Nucleotidyltransferase domain-containing protein n=1 Tax=Desulfofundulus thermobenzoicus TaxID=29376 RepID=A0A6N7IQ75_9FIRM|nr:nucleotidyltransferase domain-containing protein [Desulfofundulus thermobenzoicus]MQL52182.1 nucleotidyltransferase domain-containing protein [Desulfofundulus thermobenzoicus]HHW45078.1 nucleotidyltransferase domain-containing protein [Desulfotomaculum sp.]
MGQITNKTGLALDSRLKKLPQNRLKKLQDYLSGQKDIVAVYLFGSFGTGYQHNYSDIDLGIVFSPQSLPDLNRELTLEADIALILGRDDIDLVNLNRAALALRYRAVSQGVIIYEGDGTAASDFLENTYRLYGDYQIDLNRYYREYRKALQEAYFNGGS